MTRLPTPGQDDGSWGNILNDYLNISHNADGTLKNSTVGASQLQPGSITDAAISSSAAISKTKLAPGVQTSLTTADSSVQSVNGKTPTSGAVAIATSDLTDTNLTSLANGQVLTYSSGTSKWVNLAPATAPVTSVVGQTGAITGAQIAGDAALTATYATQLRRMLRAIPMGVTEPTVMASPPTLTWGDTVQLASPTTIAYDDARLHIQNGYKILDPVHSDFGNAIDNRGLGGMWVSFEHYGTEFDFGVYCIDSTGGTFWVEVDGQLTTATPFSPTGGLASSGAVINCFVEFGSAALRRIRIYYWSAYLRFVWVHSGDSIAAYPSPLPTAVMYGDSWVGGHNSNTEQLGIPARIGRMLGWSMGVCGQGGTGYNHAGPLNSYDDPVRVSAAAAWLPDYAIIFGTINTNAQGSAVQSYAASLYSQWATLSPKTRLFVCGVPPQGDGVTTENQQYNTAVKAAALAAPNVTAFIDMIAGTWTLHDGVTTGGAGVQWIKSAQSLVSDSHPTAAGDQYLARMISNAVVESAAATLAANL